MKKSISSRWMDNHLSDIWDEVIEKKFIQFVKRNGRTYLVTDLGEYHVTFKDRETQVLNRPV
jgi:hypothetical protein